MPEIERSLAFIEITAVSIIPLGGEVGMITRLWRGYATPENADAFEAFIRSETLPRLRGVRGFLGGKLLRRNLFQEVEFIGLTHFDSLDSMRIAAGEEFGYTLVAETGLKLLSRFDQRTAIYEVVVEEKTNT